MADSNDQRQIKKAEENEAAKEAAGVAAKGAIDYFTGGTGGAVYDQAKSAPIVGKRIDKAEQKLGKKLNKATGGKFGKAAKKAKDTGALDAANMATSMGAGGAGAAGKGAAGANQAPGGPKLQSPNGPGSQNNGRQLLNGMKGNSKPQGDKEAEDRKKKLDAAIKIAKHVPIPQVKAAAEIADKANKLGAGNSLAGGGKKDGDGEKKNSPFDMKGSMIKKKLILWTIPAFFFLILIAGTIVVAGSSSSGGSGSVDDGLCVVDYVKEDKCDNDDPNAKAFHKRVKDIRSDYKENDKDFNPLYVVGVYFALNSEDNSITYSSFDDARIKEIADAMLKKTDESYEFDEKQFSKKLINDLLPKYLPSHKKGYEEIAEEVFDYVTRFEDIYGKEEEEEEEVTDSDYANRLVKIAQDQLKSSNPDRNKEHGNKYQRFMGLNNPKNDAWCAAFVSWCANEAEIKKAIIPHYSSVSSFYDYYVNNKHGTWHSINSNYKPQPGDLIIWYNHENAANLSHIGIVEKYKNGMVSTIEGNTGYDPTARVGRHTRTVKGTGCNGFVTPKYPKVASTKLVGSNNAQKVWNYFRNKKVSKEATAGIMGNLQQESGMNPKSIQANGPGRGLAQWSVGGRFVGLNNMAKKKGKKWYDLGVQLDYIWYELNKGGNGSAKHLSKIRNVIEATDYFEQTYERAGKPVMSNRYAYARGFLKKYGGKK